MEYSTRYLAAVYRKVSMATGSCSGRLFPGQTWRRTSVQADMRPVKTVARRASSIDGAKAATQSPRHDLLHQTVVLYAVPRTDAATLAGKKIHWVSII